MTTDIDVRSVSLYVVVVSRALSFIGFAERTTQRLSSIGSYTAIYWSKGKHTCIAKTERGEKGESEKVRESHLVILWPFSDSRLSAGNECFRPSRCSKPCEGECCMSPASDANCSDVRGQTRVQALFNAGHAKNPIKHNVLE